MGGNLVQVFVKNRQAVTYLMDVYLHIAYLLID